MMSYEQRERADVRKRLAALAKSSLADRKAAQADLLEALRDPERIEESLNWLLDGSYGYGEMLLAQDILHSRGNREAQLTVLLGGLEWQVPASEVPLVWKKLHASEQKALAKAIQAAIREAERANR